jgi:hypothetical protein
MSIFRGSKDATTAQGQVVATTEEIVDLIEQASTEALANDLVNKFKENVFKTDETINRDDGGIQVLTLSSDVTVNIDMGEGQSLTLHVKGLDTHTVTWPTSATFIGGLPSTFNPNLDVFEFWVVESELYGAWVGGA